ncbi:LysM peptidoglycan-binding domain-containing protein [Paenibacillus sp. J2TS4]|uniref:LysM peptidoglycan-binding domain-containing protein n=1 Tax=Paenibacillus sp. J2TS4 TaxID=2807194 RepID=UPI001B246230|nr:LysM peptidoglycan-binding domain-containing protein [Paenibacillus sp. J2TS4]GIP35509.1 peptidoglycan-binding protein LysM [Paenibacillus sp. J2TS4]
MAMEIIEGVWLSYNNQEEGFRLPVNPPSIEVKEAGSGKKYTILGQGEVNVIQAPELREVSFESFFPLNKDKDPYVVSDKLEKPMWYVEYIQKWMATKRPIRFVYAGSNVYVDSEGVKIAELNIPASIESFTWREVAGSPGDLEFKMSLKEYVFYSAVRTTIIDDQGEAVLEAQQPQRPDEREPLKTYTLVAGDGLWKVAQKCLGDGSRYREIQQLNGISDAQLDRLPIGMTLQLP